VLHLVEVMIGGAHSRGEGCAVTVAEYATAILYNGLGEYELAFEAAQKAAAADEIATSSWALSELVEAAARSGRQEIARESLDELCERTSASGTAWAKGTEARVSALLEDGESAEHLYRAAIEALGRSQMAAHLARARLSYGEWLRREKRRVDAREPLRQAYDVFATIGADGFADRARQIAKLARNGRTNPEIGTELYISPRTVEWHLGQVYTKLGISSRKGLRGALQSRYRDTPV
jgi:ATP/maltotriose-dependent transcriptional regulator MalT